MLFSSLPVDNSRLPVVAISKSNVLLDVGTLTMSGKLVSEKDRTTKTGVSLIGLGGRLAAMDCLSTVDVGN